jgi:hypothetical protein
LIANADAIAICSNAPGTSANFLTSRNKIIIRNRKFSPADASLVLPRCCIWLVHTSTPNNVAARTLPPVAF